MLQSERGKIVKGIAGFYYVHTSRGLYECKARGVFRKDNQKPLCGDDVEIEILPGEEGIGSITRLLPRKNALLRPACANVDQAVLLFAVSQPEPSFALLDKLILRMRQVKLPVIIGFNKADLLSEQALTEITDIYAESGCTVLTLSGKEQYGIDTLKEYLAQKTTVLAGPSGVGKSTLVNLLFPEANMETGALSRKLARGKHTTRHAELFALSDDTFLMDTPGFTSLLLSELSAEELRDIYPEFLPYEKECRFGGCSHITEKICGVKEAVRDKKIHPVRYENYKQLYTELREQKRW